MAAVIPQRTVHIATRGNAKTHCGRNPLWGSRVHSSWPRCKTCARIQAKHGGTLITYYDGDGWSIPQTSGSYGVTFTSNTASTWTFINCNIRKAA